MQQAKKNTKVALYTDTKKRYLLEWNGVHFGDLVRNLYVWRKAEEQQRKDKMSCAMEISSDDDTATQSMEENYNARNGHSSTSSSFGGDEEFDEDEEIELVVQGKEIVVKESLLVKHSKYFAQIFGNLDPEVETLVLKHGKLDGEEHLSKEKQDEPLTLISYATMRTIVDFLQSGALKIGEQNVRHLLIASDLLVIGDVETECFNFLKSNLTPGNCVKHFVLADAKTSWTQLSKHIAHYIQLHFDQLSKLTQIYQMTSADQFRRIIADECLAVNKEEQVLEAVFEWINYDLESRREHLPMLLAEVQWPLLRNTDLLQETLSNPLIASEESCVAMITEALRYHDLSYEEKVHFWSTGGRKRPSRWPKLLAALSYADKMIECFDFEEQRWFVLTEKPTATFGAEMCYLNGKLYTLGGVQTKQVDQFDLESCQWATHFPSLTQFRVAHGLVADGNRLYVTGGSAKASQDFGPGLDEMEVLTLDEDNNVEQSWTCVGSMKTGRSYLASAADGEAGRVYVVGGCLTENRSTAEVYLTKSNKWVNIASTLTKRDSLGLVMFDSQLFAVGGYDDHNKKYLNTAERYDPDKNAWYKVKPMQMGRRSPGVVIYKGKLYAVGGMGETSDLKSVEVYDAISNKWSKFPHPLKEICGWVTCCLIEKPLRLMDAELGAEFVPPEVDVSDEVEAKATSGGKKKKSLNDNLNYRKTETTRTNVRMRGVKELRK